MMAALPPQGEEELPEFEGAEEEGAEGRGAGADGKDGRSELIKATGFRDFLLKDDLMRGITECGFEHPSEVQHACISQAVLGTDILCQAKSGMGKTAVFVLACLQSLDVSQQAVRVLVLCHTRELAYQIQHEFQRLGKHLPGMKVAAVYGGSPIASDKEMLKSNCPHILAGTPGRVKYLIQEKDLKLEHLTHFILDECDRCLERLDMRREVQDIFVKTPKKKQVMMFSATISPETRAVCKKFMQGPHEITVDSDSKLRLEGLLQYHLKISENQKNRKLIDLLDELEFNQVVIFVRTVMRARALNDILQECNFPSMTLHPLGKEFAHKAKKGESIGPDTSRLERFKLFKDFKKRILVSTDIFGRGIDVERVNIVINYDMPADSDMYLHRVGRAGRFGTKGLAVSFVASDADREVMSKVQDRFECTIGDIPTPIDTTSYMNA